jgi:hypothetical protein
MTTEIWIAIAVTVIGVASILLIERLFKGKSMLESLVAIFGGTLAVVILIAFALCYGAFAWGLVFWKFWYWFFLPIFPAFPAITFIQAIGLMFVVDLFKNQTQQQIKKEYKDDKSTGLMSLLNPWIVLFTGWLFKIIFL